MKSRIRHSKASRSAVEKCIEFGAYVTSKPRHGR